MKIKIILFLSIVSCLKIKNFNSLYFLVSTFFSSFRCSALKRAGGFLNRFEGNPESVIPGYSILSNNSAKNYLFNSGRKKVLSSLFNLRKRCHCLKRCSQQNGKIFFFSFLFWVEAWSMMNFWLRNNKYRICLQELLNLYKDVRLDREECVKLLVYRQ